MQPAFPAAVKCRVGAIATHPVFSCFTIHPGLNARSTAKSPAFPPHTAVLVRRVSMLTANNIPTTQGDTGAVMRSQRHGRHGLPHRKNTSIYTTPHGWNLATLATCIFSFCKVTSHKFLRRCYHESLFRNTEGLCQRASTGLR